MKRRKTRKRKPRINSYLYTEAIYITKKSETIRAINPPYLFSYAKYKTNVTKDHLPEYFVNIVYRYLPAYLNSRDVVGLVFRASAKNYESLKEDYLYISYKGKLDKNKNHVDLIFDADVCLYGYWAYVFIKAVLKYSSYDLTESLEAIKDRFDSFNKEKPDKFKELISETNFYNFFEI